MRLKYWCLFPAFMLMAYTFSYGQTTSSLLRGSVFIQNGVAANAATVVLLNRRDSAIIASTLVSGKGSYEFTNVKPGTYFLLTTSLGYQKNYSAPYQVTAGRDITAAPVYLTATDNILAEVIITAKKPFVEVKPGKTIINPQASITADGKNVLDILRQSPGVRVDNNESISVVGRQSALVMIDGKTTGLTGDDLAALLKSMEGSNIERMELITGGSSRYDASAGGIINIVLKKGKNNGTNGTFTAGAGFGLYQRLNTGITLNSRTSHLNLFGSYNIADNKNYYNFTSNRNINSKGIKSGYNSVYGSTQENVSHNYRAGADYYITPEQTIGVLVYGSVSNNTIIKDNILSILNQGKLDSAVQVNSNLKRDFNYINYNLNYSGRLSKAGNTLSANVTYSPYSRTSDEYITNNFYLPSGSPYRNALLLQNLSPSNRHNFTGNIDYVNPLSKKSRIEAGVKYSNTKSNNNLIFGPKVGNVYTVDSSFSNRFVYDEKVSHAYMNFNGSYGKYDVQLGLRGEYTESYANSVTLNQMIPLKYFNLFPNVLLSYRYNDKNDYALSYTRGIQRPSYEGLNPFLYYVDPYNYRSGNPYLKPEYTDVIRVTHTYDHTLSTALYASFITDANFDFYRQNDSTRVSVLTARNLGMVYSYGITINAPVKFFNWWNASFDLDASYQRYKVYPRLGNFNKSTGDVIFVSTQNFNMTKTFSAEVTGRYESANFYGITQYKSAHNIDAGISKLLFNKTGKLSLVATDIFNTLRTRAAFNFQNVDLQNTVKRETRFLKLNFTYNFGKSSVKNARRHITGNEAEQNRMRTGSN